MNCTMKKTMGTGTWECIRPKGHKFGKHVFVKVTDIRDVRPDTD